MNPKKPTNSGFSSQGIAQATVILIIGTLLSRVLGFAREMVIAHMFGATVETDAYLIAFIIPGVFASLVAGAIIAAFVPVFTEYRIKQGEEKAWRIASTLINVTLGFLISGSVITLLTAPTVVRLLGPGLAPETRSIAVHLVQVMSPAIIFVGLSGLSTGILNSYKHFISPAFAGIPYNIGIIAGALLLASRFGITGLAIGVNIGAFGQLLLQLMMLAKKRDHYALSLDLSNPGVKRIAWLMLPFLVGSAATQLNQMVDRILASGLVEGSIAALNFGFRVKGLPLGVLGAAIGIAVYPTLSQQVAEGRLDRLRNTFSAGIRMVFFLTIPATIGLVVLRKPIIRLLFERGAFDAIATSMAATALLFYALGLVAQAGNMILIRTFFALQDTKMPVKLGVMSVAVNILLNLILVRYMALGGLALASSIAASANFMLLAYFLRKNLGHLEGRRILRSATKCILASLVMGLVCWTAMNLSRSIFDDMNSLKHQLLQVGGLVFIGVLTYLVLAILLRMEELVKIKNLRSIFARR